MTQGVKELINEFIQERKSLVILIIVILFLLLGLVYLNLVKPLKDESKTAKTNIEVLETDIQLLQAQVEGEASGQADRPDNQFFLERKMPLDRSIDELILSLQEIEMISEVRLENISFNNYDSGLTEADQVIDREEDTEETGDVDGGELNDDVETEVVDEFTEPPVSDVAENLPANVKLITVELSVISPNFHQFEVFLQEIEKLERVTRVDTLSFSKPGEQDLLNPEGEADTTVSIDVQITTFYYDENGASSEE